MRALMRWRSQMCPLIVWLGSCGVVRAQMNTAAGCDAMVAAVANEYQQKCLDPLDNCVPNAAALASFTTVSAACSAATQAVCIQMLDCEWSTAQSSCRHSRTAVWTKKCGHSRNVCPRGPGCVLPADATAARPACLTPSCGCDNVQNQWCQSVVDSIVQNCGSVPVPPPNLIGQNSTGGGAWPMRLGPTGVNETYAGWPFPAERTVLDEMGCNFGTFSVSRGLDSFDLVSIAAVCFKASAQLPHYCACGRDSMGVQGCDLQCTTAACQHRFLAFHDACCGGDTCTTGPLTLLGGSLDPTPLDAKHTQCEGQRAAEVAAAAAGGQTVNPLPDAVHEMCRMAWDTIYNFVNMAGHTVCDQLLYIRTTWRVCNNFVPMDGNIIDYRVIEEPSYCMGPNHRIYNINPDGTLGPGHGTLKPGLIQCRVNDGTQTGGRIWDPIPGTASANDVIMQGSCTDIDECVINNGGCSHGCRNNFGAPPTCTCPAGLENPPACDMCFDLCHCSGLYGVLLNGSSNSPCENGGICQNGHMDGFTCSCPPGFTGDMCERFNSTTQCDVGWNCPFISEVQARDGRGAVLVEPFAPVLLSSHSAQSRVGVGIQAPRDKLDVAGTFKVEGDFQVQERAFVHGATLVSNDMAKIDVLLDLYGRVPAIMCPALLHQSDCVANTACLWLSSACIPRR